MGFGYSSAPTVGLGGGYNNPFDIPGGTSGGGIDWGQVLGIGGQLALGGLNAYQNQQQLNSNNAMTKEQLAEHKREFDIQNSYRNNPQYRAMLAQIGQRFGLPASAFQPSSAPSAPGPTGGTPPTPGAPTTPTGTGTDPNGGDVTVMGPDGKPYGKTIRHAGSSAPPMRPWTQHLLGKQFGLP